MNPKRIDDPERVAALATAVETYRAAVARAEADLLDALAAARTGPRPVTWRAIGECFGTTHQAVISRWNTMAANRKASTPTQPPRSPPKQADTTIDRLSQESGLVTYLFDRTET